MHAWPQCWAKCAGSGRRRLQQSQSARQEAAPADVPQKAPHADPRAAARQQQQPPRRQQPPQQQPRQPEQGRAQPVMPQVMVENVDLTACALEMRAKAEQLHDLWNSHKQLAAQQAAIAEQVGLPMTSTGTAQAQTLACIGFPQHVQMLCFHYHPFKRLCSPCFPATFIPEANYPAYTYQIYHITQMFLQQQSGLRSIPMDG